jgi:DNA-binding protein
LLTGVLFSIMGVVKFYARLWVQLQSQAQQKLETEVEVLKQLKSREDDPLQEPLKSDLAAQYLKVAEAQTHMTRTKKETDEYVDELTTITDVQHKISEVLLGSKYSRTIGDATEAYVDLRDRLCGDIQEIRCVPGRREIAHSEVCLMCGGQLRGITIFLFNDIIVTTAQGSSKEFEIYQNKIELSRTHVEVLCCLCPPCTPTDL